MKYLLLSVCCVVVVYCAPSPKNDDNYDHYTFTHQWPAGECAIARDQCIVPAGNNAWTLHGLWPTNGTTHGPYDCDKSHPFNFTIIQKLLPALRQYWPSIYPSHTEEYFWGHEWDKHGTCAEGSKQFSGEFNYFSGALTLAHTHNVTKAFEAAGIYPSDTKVLHIDDISKALKDAFKVEPAVKCVHDSKLDRYVMIEVELCILKTTLELVDCSKFNEKTSCWESDEIAYISPPKLV